MAAADIESHPVENNPLSDVERVRVAAVATDAPGVVSNRPKISFVPKPVAFLAFEIVKFIDEISSKERILTTKGSPALDAVALGTP